LSSCEPDKLLIREKYYIYLGAEYNIVKDPTIPPMPGRTHSEETKQILSEKLKGENHPNFGQTLSNETKTKISEAHTGKTHDEETKTKISDAMVGNTNKKGQTLNDDTKKKYLILKKVNKK